jgi:hypothetical protein
MRPNVTAARYHAEVTSVGYDGVYVDDLMASFCKLWPPLRNV